MSDPKRLEVARPRARAWGRVRPVLERIRGLEASPSYWSASSLSLTVERSPTWIFAPKLRALHATVDTDRLSHAGRYGSLVGSEAPLRAAIRRGAKVWFVGDLDPLDLAVYLQLVAALPGRDVRLGIGERALASIGGPQTFQSISMDRTEVRAWKVLRPELADVVGPTATALLDRGIKIEIDSFWSLARRGQFDVADLFATMGIRAKLRPA